MRRMGHPCEGWGTHLSLITGGQAAGGTPTRTGGCKHDTMLTGNDSLDSRRQGIAVWCEVHGRVVMNDLGLDEFT